MTIAEKLDLNINNSTQGGLVNKIAKYIIANEINPMLIKKFI